MNNYNNLDLVITDAIKKITELSDVNMIIGSPILTKNGATIIPVSKITVGFMSGGGEYGDNNLFSKSGFPHTGGSGGILSMKPSGFIIEKNDEIKFVHCPTDVFDKAINACEDLIKDINEKK